MIPRDPFILLIIYLLLTGAAVSALAWVLRRMKVPLPWLWIVPLIVGVFLLFTAFSMAGLPIF